MTVFEGIWSLVFILVMGLLLVALVAWLAALAERLVNWIRGR